MSSPKTAPTSSDVIVVGAGMNGLLAAFYLLEKGLVPEVYEISAHEGGKVRTEKTPYGRRELAANALLADAEVERVAQVIGLQLKEKNSAASRRYIWREGSPRQWPLGILASIRALVFLLSQLFKLSWCVPKPLETLEEWGHRVLGAEATTYLLNPACQGIFGCDSAVLSGPLVYNYFFGRRRKVRGRLRGSVAPEGGMGEFPKHLRAYLEKRAVVFHFGKTPLEKPKVPVVVATDFRSAEKILRTWGDGRAQELAKIPAVDLFSLNAFYKRPPATPKPSFGILFPQNEGIEPIGVLLSSYIFPDSVTVSLSGEEKNHSETWIFGGSEGSPMKNWDEARFLGSLKKSRALILRDMQEPLAVFINRWPGALPLYGKKLEEVLVSLPIHLDGVSLLGNYLGEIGLNRFFHRAGKVAEKIAEDIKTKN
jgi:oxygen-dependent protoporphyrinogen oxidase